MRLNVMAFALTCSLLWGSGVFICAWWIMSFDGRGVDLGVLSHVYRGYAATPMGSVIGLVWGLADGFGGGLIFAWLYNLLSGRSKTGA